MKHVARRAARLSRALIGATALGACLANPAAAAQTADVGMQCLTPPANIVDGTLHVETSLPHRWNRTSPPSSVTWKVRYTEPINRALFLNRQTAYLTVRITDADGHSQVQKLMLSGVSRVEASPISTAYELAISAPAPSLAGDGAVRFEIEHFALNVASQTGGQLNFDGTPVVPTDADPNTADVPCRVAPGAVAPSFRSTSYSLGDPSVALNLASRCKHGSIDRQPGSLRIEASVPKRWDRTSPPTSLNWRFRYEDGGQTATWLLGQAGLWELRGSAVADVEVRSASGTTAIYRVPIQLDEWRRTSDAWSAPVVWSGSTDSLVPTLAVDGDATFRVVGFGINYTPIRRDGTPALLKPLTSDYDGNPVTDSDGIRESLDVYCRIDAGQDQTLATTQVVSGPATERGIGTFRGALGIPKLFASQAPLSGSYDLVHKRSDHTVSGDLALKATSARLVGSVTGRIELVRTGSATGKLVDGELTLQQLVRIRVGEVKLFGAVPIAGGVSCQAKSPSLVKLKSTDPVFSFEKGGTLEGTFDLSDLNGCPTLAGIVNSASASTGNTIRLVLAPSGMPGV